MSDRRSLLHQSWRLLTGDCRDTLAELEPCSVQTCVTSPPYFGLRDYGTGEWQGGDSSCDHREGRQTGRVTPASKNGTDNANVTRWNTCGHCGAARVDRQVGLEPTPDEFVAALVDVFRAVRRVLADDGTVWLNLGDSYNNRSRVRPSSHQPGINSVIDGSWASAAARGGCRVSLTGGDVKEKDLLGIPWMVAFALRADGWYLRSDIIWAKPNPMPESVTDRPTKAHEYLFLLSKSKTYFYDHEAIREEGQEWPGRAGTFARNGAVSEHVLPGQAAAEHRSDREDRVPAGRNKRSVWTIATQPYPGAHFATFPPKLIEPCILAGCPEGGVVLDPFAGAGTTAVVALRHARSFIGCELSPEYVELARDRIIADSPLLNTHAEAA